VDSRAARRVAGATRFEDAEPRNLRWYAKRTVKKLNKPQYLFRPQQLLMGRRWRVRSPAQLPWGLTLAFAPTGRLGRSLAHGAVYDLVVSEVLWRLLENGDAAVDAGANIGYMTSIMARRVGPAGRVDAFEPNPRTFQLLASNVSCWNASVTLHDAALADAPGTVALYRTADGDGNEIRASLQPPDDAREALTVQAVTLDAAITHEVKLLKLDTEGSELLVLRGAERLLRRLEHIVYEDHDGQPSALTRRLTRAGYTVLVLEEGFLGPKVHRDVTRPRGLGWDPPSLVATRSPGAVIACLRPRGWRCLRG
jgi:FkbM family methyltransferase